MAAATSVIACPGNLCRPQALVDSLPEAPPHAPALPKAATTTTGAIKATRCESKGLEDIQVEPASTNGMAGIAETETTCPVTGAVAMIEDRDEVGQVEFDTEGTVDPLGQVVATVACDVSSSGRCLQRLVDLSSTTGRGGQRDQVESSILMVSRCLAALLCTLLRGQHFGRCSSAVRSFAAISLEMMWLMHVES